MRPAAARRRSCRRVASGRSVPVRSAADDLGGAVTALAAAEPDAPYGLARFLGSEHPAHRGRRGARRRDGDPRAAAFAAVLALAGAASVSVVWIDAASFAARPTRAEPGVLRLAAHGLPTAVVRRGDDLADELSARRSGGGRAWRRTALAALLPAVAITAAWSSLEQPRLIVRRRGGRRARAAPAPWCEPDGPATAALSAAALAAAWIAFGAEPWELLPFRDERVFAPVVREVAQGVVDFYAVFLPFDPREYVEMHSLVLCAIFGFTLGSACWSPHAARSAPQR